MDIYIENITTIENRNKVYTKLCRNIYEVIQNILNETDIFPDDFIKKCRNNPNEAQFLPLEVKNSIKRMATEQGLYAQVVMIFQKYFKTTDANKDKIEAKFKFQGQSARSHRWFDLGFYWIEVHFSTHEPELYRKIFQRHNNKQDSNTSKIFEFPIGTSNILDVFESCLLSCL